MEQESVDCTGHNNRLRAISRLAAELLESQEGLCSEVAGLDRKAPYTPNSRRVLHSVLVYSHDPYIPSL